MVRSLPWPRRRWCPGPQGGQVTGPGTTQDAEDADPAGEATGEAAFAHTATDRNSRGDYTCLSDPGVDGDPNAVVLATPSRDRGSAGNGPYDRSIGVWFELEEQRWAIFNQDRAAMPEGAAFNVTVSYGAPATD